MPRLAEGGTCSEMASSQPAETAMGSAAPEAPGSCLTPLDQLVAEFQNRVGTATAARCEGEWELPSDEGSDVEDGAARKRSARRALRTLGDLQHDFDGRPVRSPACAGAAAEAAPTSQPLQVGKGGDAAASRAGTLVKVVQHKGFGFILPDGSQVADVLLHCSQLARGGLRDMHVGMRVRYVEETDARTGKRRAKTAAVIDQEGASGATNGVARGGVAGASYSREKLLRTFATIGRSSNGPSRCMFSAIRVPQACSSESGSRSSGSSSAEEPSWAPGLHASLDDEYLIGKLEERLSRESGFDDMNEETFGESSGWSFEEAVAANAKLAVGLPFGLGAAALAAAEAAEKNWNSTLAGSTTGSGSSDAGYSPCESPWSSPVLCAAKDEAMPLYVLAGLQLQ